ncbi:MAG: TadE-like protein [Clostridiales bacterium]|jgi:Flp pilus assembly protein TadG|nr:TadE-like protein [Clostridiales bacterium]MDN5283701.1 TadE-like protein [Candidatus Ozemobacter sp.]
MSRKKRGQAVVEMALVLPIFIFVIIGIFDFGRALHIWSNLNYQCMQAARAATKRINPLIARNLFTPSTHPTLEEVQAAFWKFRSPLMPEDQYSNVTFTGVGTSDTQVEVKASFNLTLYTPLVGALVDGENGGGALTVTASARENKE